MLSGDLAHPRLQLCGPLHGNIGPKLISHQRIGPIGGQLQAFGHVGQGVLPVGQLRGDTTVRILQITKLFALPQRVVDILHRQRRPDRGLPAHRLA